MRWPGKRRKFGNKPIVENGKRFDSMAEFIRWNKLVLLQRAGQISRLEFHPRFKLDVNGQHICDYIGDFAYFEGWARVVEDVKGGAATQTPEFKLKAKLMKAIYNIDIRITGRGT